MLVVKNLGPARARVTSVEALNAPGLLMELGLDNLELLKDEEHRISAAPTLATPQPVKIRMTWTDSRGEHVREQTLNL